MEHEYYIEIVYKINDRVYYSFIRRKIVTHFAFNKIIIMIIECTAFALFLVILNRVYYWSHAWKKMPVVREEDLIRERKPVRYPYAVVWTPIPGLT